LFAEQYPSVTHQSFVNFSRSHAGHHSLAKLGRRRRRRWGWWDR
jgi:hypothetical protein